MQEAGTRTYDNGGEVRTLSWGKQADGAAFVREVTSGEVTMLFWNASSRESLVTFSPTQDFGLEDVSSIVESSGEDCFLGDVLARLDFWDVPFTRVDSLVPLPEPASA